MSTQSVFSSSPRIAPPYSSSPIKITSAAPPLLNSGSRSLSFPLRSTVPGKLAFRVSSTPSRIASIRCALSPDLKNTLDKVVTSQKVVLFMKGTKDFPQCGFSNTVVQILNSLNVPYETINILENEVLRQGLKEYSNWPTFPQLYIDGEFYGGCDITVGSWLRKELKKEILTMICCDCNFTQSKILAPTCS